MRFNYILIILTFFIFTCYVFPQQYDTDIVHSDSSFGIYEQNSKKLIGGSFIYGYMIPHAKEVLPVRGLNPRGYELFFNWHLYNDDVWNDCNCYPRLSLFLSYYDFDLEVLLGHGYSAGMAFTYFFGLPSDFNFHLKGRGGLSYLTNPYNPDAEIVNWSYSTNLNFILSAGGGITFRPTDRLEFQLDGSMNHQSNAAYQEPNGGINYWALALSTNYFLDVPDFQKRVIYDPYPDSEKKKRWDASFSWGISSMPFALPGKVPMYNITILRSIQLWRIFAVTFGGEFERNGRAVEWHRRYTPERAINPYRGSLQTGGEFLMGKTLFGVQLGWYIYRPYVEKDDVYQRFYLMYNIFNDIYTGITFKSYRNSADHFSFRFTYSFR